MADIEREADAILARAAQELADVSPGPFSPKAFQLLQVKVSEQVRSLILESGKISRRHGADVISASYVEQASDYLVTGSTRRWLRHFGTVGGILLGAAISNFLSMTTIGHYTTAGVAVSAVLAVAGAFGVALHIGNQ
jgi:hypothetical protein